MSATRRGGTGDEGRGTKTHLRKGKKKTKTERGGGLCAEKLIRLLVQPRRKEKGDREKKY